MAEIGKKFNIPRTTVYGIINNKDALINVAKGRLYGGPVLEPGWFQRFKEQQGGALRALAA